MNMFGFIGTGNMGGALAKAVAAKCPEEVVLSNRTMAKAEALAKTLNCRVDTVENVAWECQYLFLGVKPQMMADLLKEIAPVLEKREDLILVSMAAGLTIADIQCMAGKCYPVIRIMPNTPVAVGEGVVLYTVSETVTVEMKNAFCEALSGAGLLDEIPEKLMDAGSAVSGCGPAFACLFVEALADGGVACGLPRAKALTYAAQMLKGTAKLILESGEHPGKLKDAVCSPGGSTIAGVRSLEQGNFRGSTIDAVESAFHRTKELVK